MNGTVDWAALERLRAIFLEGAPVKGSYWRNRTDLASYDATLGERIGWKWDAVLGELKQRGWTPPRGPLLDFGCGSGIASRRVVAVWGADHFTALHLHDRSGLAVEFAREASLAAFPKLTATAAGSALLDGSGPVGTLVVSHVLSEMPAKDRSRLVALAARAAAVLWVEPGTHADSHALIAVREQLRGTFRVVAPCTHGTACGLLTPGNERHWCHHFAKPPGEIFADPAWAEFAARLGIDRRSLPYSCLVLDRAPAEPGDAGWSRVIGAPRMYKGYAKMFSCGADGVRDLRLQKRAAPELFKHLDEADSPRRFRWRTEGDDIVAIEDAALGSPPPAG